MAFREEILLPMREMWRPAAHVVIAVCLLGLLLVRESRELPLSDIDTMFVDWLAGNSQRDLKPPPLVFTEINDSSLKSEAWPWLPFDYALFFQALMPFDPAVVACEPVLHWSTEGSDRTTQYDRMLTELMRRAPKVLLGARLGQREDPDMLELQRTPLLPHIFGDTSSLLQYSLVEDEPEEQFSLTARIGFTNLDSAQNHVRRVPLVFLYRGQVVPSFALQAMMLWLQLTPDDVAVEVGKRISLGNKIEVPIDDRGMVLADFGAPITKFGVDDLLLAAEQTSAKLPVAVPVREIKDNIVLLARTDSGSDSLRLPDGTVASPGEVIAATIATIQQQTFIRRVGAWFDFVFIGFVAVCGAFLVRLKAMNVVLVVVGIFGVYLLGCLSVFGLKLVWLPLVLPVCLLLFVTLYAVFLPARKVKAAPKSSE